MTEHEFTLVIDGDLADEKVAATLFEVGCDDATFGIIDGIGYGEFIREASTFADAVMSAIRQVESVAGLRVMHIEPDDIVTMTDIAERLDRTRESVRLLIAGQRGPGSFLRQFRTAGSGVVFGDGRTWRSGLARSNPRRRNRARFTAAVNAALELRHRLDQMTDEIAAKELRSLAKVRARRP